MFAVLLGSEMDKDSILHWIVKQKTDESIEEVNRETFLNYIETKDFLAVVFCKMVVAKPYFLYSN
jgi:hypothetical protein